MFGTMGTGSKVGMAGYLGCNCYYFIFYELRKVNRKFCFQTEPGPVILLLTFRMR